MDVQQQPTVSGEIWILEWREKTPILQKLSELSRTWSLPGYSVEAIPGKRPIETLVAPGLVEASGSRTHYPLNLCFYRVA